MKYPICPHCEGLIHLLEDKESVLQPGDKRTGWCKQCQIIFDQTPLNKPIKEIMV